MTPQNLFILYQNIFWPLLPISPTAPYSHLQPPPICSLWVWFFGFHIEVRSCSICLSRSDLFHLVWHPRYSSILSQAARFPSYLWLGNITPVLWPPPAKSWLIGKDPDAGRDWGQEEKGTTEDEMAGWHHLDGLESEWTPGDGDGQGGLACRDSWGRKESDTTEWLNWTELNISIVCMFVCMHV